MDIWFYFVGSCLLLWMGISLLRSGISAVRNKKPAIGMWDPKMNLLHGPLGIAAGIVILIKMVILPLLFE